MKRLLLLIGVLAIMVPSAFAQRGIDGNVLDTEVKLGVSYEGGRSSEVGTVDIKHRFSEALAAEAILNGGMYYGNGIHNDLKSFAGLGLSATYNFSKNLYVSAGGLRNTPNADTATMSAFGEVGALMYSSGGLIRAIEGDYNQGYRSYSGITFNNLVITSIKPTMTAYLFDPRVIVYLPREMDIMVQAGVADVTIGGVKNMKEGAAARFRIPITHRVQLTASAGFNSESMIQVAQVTSLAARNYGAGMRFWVNRALSVEVAGTKSSNVIGGLPDGTIYGVSITKRF